MKNKELIDIEKKNVEFITCTLKYKDLFKNEDLVRFWVVDLKRIIMEYFNNSPIIQQLVCDHLTDLEEMNVLTILTPEPENLTNIQHEILHLLDTLPENDRDIDNLCIALDPNFEKYGSFFKDGIPFKEEVEKNLIELLVKGFITKQTKNMETILQNGEKKIIPYTIYTKTKPQILKPISFKIYDKVLSIKLRDDKN